MNKGILDEVKHSINELIVSLNETTLHTVTLSETKVTQLKQCIGEAEVKLKQLEFRLKNFEKREIKAKDTIKQTIDIKSDSIENEIPFFYKPESIFLRSEVIRDEISTKDTILKKELEFEKTQFEKLTIIEKIKYLNNKGLTPSEIRTQLSIDAGEFDFLVNIEGINLKF
ncbi:MAG: hypothetical protein A2355_14300 [Spirochaetes bacterium RIFOXYB1_FULL_32_8]|nr:MAG: hypothetical protein A2355_14300 [Spirochaetes bacterium RIFOXYB1_FULL_32_8]